MPDEPRLGVLFVNTATVPPLGADTWIHTQIMAGLDRATHDLYAACAFGPAHAPTPTFAALRSITDLDVRPIDLGPELSGRSRWQTIVGLVATLPAVVAVVRLRHLVKRRGISVIHTSDRPRDAAACILVARLTRRPCIVHVHVAFSPEWMGGLLKWAMRKADALVAVSQFVADTLVEGGHATDRVHVVPNAIDVDRWQPSIGRNEVRREFGFDEADVVVITVCRLFAEKGPADLIRAFARVAEGAPHARLMIVGVAPVPAFRVELGALVDELGIADRVVFTGHRSDVPALMAGSDVFAMPSTREPFGLVFAEAMAMRLPVVGLDDGGTVEVVVHGETGLLSTFGDLDGLVGNLSALVGDPALRERLGAAGRRRVESHFRRDRMATDVARVYRLVASAEDDTEGERT